MKRASLLVVAALAGLLVWLAAEPGAVDPRRADERPASAEAAGARPATHDVAPTHQRAPVPHLAPTHASPNVTLRDTETSGDGSQTDGHVTGTQRRVNTNPPPVVAANTRPQRPAANVLDPSTLPENYTLTAEANPAPIAPIVQPDAVDTAESTVMGVNTIEPPDDVTFDGVRPEDEDITFDGVRDVTFDGVRPVLTPAPVLVLGPPTPDAPWDGAGLSPTEAGTFEAPDYTNSIEANPPEVPAALDTETVADPPPVWDGEGTDTTEG